MVVFVCSEFIAFTEGKSTDGGGLGGLGDGLCSGSVSSTSLVVEALS